MAFLVFEGIDGAGKSTLIQGLEEVFRQREISYLVTREPGGTPLAEEIRHLLLKIDQDPPVARTELLLYQASRAQHVEKVIRPQLERGGWVLCDRYTYSSLAFQAGGRGLEEGSISWLNNYATQGLEAHLVILLDLTVEESQRRQMKRCQEKGVELDRFEQEKEQFHIKVRDHYLKQAGANSERWLIVDATLSPDEILHRVLTELRSRQWLD
ncbi:MAG: dTMP kinase [Bdellovibrionales bacterium]|nr:dTMP kinase [Bdellovibrionales bacterium]